MAKRQKNDPFSRMGIDDVKPPTERLTYGDQAEAHSAEEQQSQQSAETAKPKRGRGRPKKPTTQPNGLQPGEERITVVMEKALGDDLRDYAYTERMTLRDAMELAVSSFLKSERERGVQILKRK